MEDKMAKLKLNRKQIKYLAELGVEHWYDLDRVYSYIIDLIDENSIGFEDVEFLDKVDFQNIIDHLDELYPDGWKYLD
jgi:hypothetical protein